MSAFEYSILAIIALYILAILYVFVIRTSAHHWLTASGRIVSAEVIRGAKGYEEFVVEYHFKVKGDIHKGSRLIAGGEMSWSSTIPGISSASSFADRYKVGDMVTVYYHSKYHWLNALERGDRWNTIPVLLIAVSMLLLLLFVFFK